MPEKQLSEAQIEAKLVREYPLFFLQMNEMQSRFVRCKNKAGRTPKRRLDESGNKGGKTHIGIAEDLAHSFGKRYWLPEDDPDYLVPVRVPNMGIIGCETMMHSVPEKIWPTLKLLIPKTCRYSAKKNPAGQIQKVVFHTDPEGKKCESEIYIRSYDQEAGSFEGIDSDWIHWDEPPPKPILQAAERGKIVTNAPSWFTMTPLKEAYIYDEYSLKAANTGGDDDEIAVIRGEIWENCIDWCFKCGTEIPENREIDPDTQALIRPVHKCPNCGRIMGFITKAGIDEYLKTLDPEEREAREKGIWRHLSGLVYKILDRDEHLYEDFRIPQGWMKIEGIDPHDARPTPYIFGAVSPEEIEIYKKIRHRIYIYDYLLLKDGDIDEMVRKIKVKRAEHGYSKPKWIVLDAKYGVRTEMEGKSWEAELRKRNIGNIRLSQSKPGDVAIGHKIVREYLKPYMSTLTGKAKPGLLFAREGCRGAGGPVHQMFNYQYKENADKPEEKAKDCPDIIRYMCLEEPVFVSQEDDRKVVELLTKRREKVVNQRRLGGVM
jgi:hypothetical protein